MKKEKPEMGAEAKEGIPLPELAARMLRALEDGRMDDMSPVERADLRRDLLAVREIAAAGGDVYEMIMALVQPKGTA